MDSSNRAPRDPSSAVSLRTVNGAVRDLVALLDVIRTQDGSTRLTLARDTGLSRNVVTQRLADLHASGLIVESGNDVSSGGRPPRQLQFNPKLGTVLVADLGATSIDVGIADLRGHVLLQRSEPADIAAGPEPVLSRVEQLFDEIQTEVDPAPGVLWAIGIGVPGPVEFSTGRPVSPPIMPGWDGYAVRERLSCCFGVPVWVDNDVNVMALGEWAEGTARGYDDVIFIKVGTGIGAGIISHGSLQRGAQGSAGDVGHIEVVSDTSVICRCGKIGCLEAVAGGAALGRAATRAAEQGESPLLAEALTHRGVLAASDIAAAARHGDTVSIKLLRQAGHHIGHMLATMVSILNPSLIVIGGGVAAAGDILMAGIREIVYGRSLPLATRHLQIRQSTLGERAGVAGAAAMAIDELFAPHRMAAWIGRGLPAGRPERVPY